VASAITDVPVNVFTTAIGDGISMSAAGSNYLETCRFVRVGGINRVTVDTRLENNTLIRTTPVRTTYDSSSVTLNTDDVANYQKFAACYLKKALGNSVTIGGDRSCTSTNNSIALPTNYPNATSSKVNTAMLTDQLYQSDGTTLSTLATTFTNSDSSTFTACAHSENLLNMVNGCKPTVAFASDSPAWYYNVHMRGLYVDFIPRETQTAVACIGATTDPSCTSFVSKTLLDVVPFFAVNLTNLTYWRKPAIVLPQETVAADSSNNVLYAMDNGFPQTYGATFTRGVTQTKANNVANVEGFTYRGNTSLADQRAVDPNDEGEFGTGASTTRQKKARRTTK
jgi:hypothetical protein